MSIKNFEFSSFQGLKKYELENDLESQYAVTYSTIDGRRFFIYKTTEWKLKIIFEIFIYKLLSLFSVRYEKLLNNAQNRLYNYKYILSYPEKPESVELPPFSINVVKIPELPSGLSLHTKCQNVACKSFGKINYLQPELRDSRIPNAKKFDLSKEAINCPKCNTETKINSILLKNCEFDFETRPEHHHEVISIEKIVTNKDVLELKIYGRFYYLCLDSLKLLKS